MHAPLHRAGLLTALAFVAAAVALGAAQAAEPSVPETLGQPAGQLAAGLGALADAEDLERARQLHRERVQPPAEPMQQYAPDLAGEDGRLLSTYLDRLSTQLAAGNLSDARSLAGAGAQLIDDEVRPVAERWDENRTAAFAGPPETTEAGVRVPLVLANPPPSGIAAYDVSLTLPGAEPVDATIELGQGETRLDPANGTVRWASFDASSMARLSPRGADRVVLGAAVFSTDTLSPGSSVTLETQANEVLDPEGRPVAAVGVDGQREVPEDPGGVGEAWWALAGVGVAAATLGWWVHRWEV